MALARIERETFSSQTRWVDCAFAFRTRLPKSRRRAARDGVVKSIAVLSTVRNDTFFTRRWIDYYARQFGAQSLYLILDGHDQVRPDPLTGINVVSMPYVGNQVITAEKRRARRTSDVAAALFHSYDIVIAVDIDEFIVLDPQVGASLAEYLSAMSMSVSVSGLGLDVIQNIATEQAIDPARPMLDQRHYAHLSARYTKPAIATRPVRWGSGQHRVHWHNFHIDPNLFLFHFGCVDAGVLDRRSTDADRLSAGWGPHQARRSALFDMITSKAAVDGDTRFASARREQTWRRPFYAWNKPGMLKGDDVITIPERFRGIV